MGKTTLLIGLWTLALIVAGQAFSLSGDDFFTIDVLEGMPPSPDQGVLYDAFMRLWDGLFGRSHCSLRLSSILFATLGAFSFARLLRENDLYSHQALGLFLFFPLATSQLLAIRPYGLYLWLAVEALRGWLGLRRGFALGRLNRLGLSCAGLVLVHTYGLVFAGILYGVACVHALSLGRRAVTLHAVWGGMLLALVGLRLQPIFGAVEMLGKRWRVVYDVPPWLFAEKFVTSLFGDLGSLACVVFLGWAWLFWRYSRGDGIHHSMALFIVVAHGIALPLFWLGWQRGYHGGFFRYLIYLAPLYVLPAASFLKGLAADWRAKTCYGLVVCVFAFGIFRDLSRGHEDWRSAAAYLEERSLPSMGHSGYLVCYDKLLVDCIQYYLADPAPIIVFDKMKVEEIFAQSEAFLSACPSLMFIHGSGDYRFLWELADRNYGLTFFRRFGEVELMELRCAPKALPLTVSIEETPGLPGDLTWEPCAGAAQSVVLVGFPGNVPFRYETQTGRFPLTSEFGPFLEGVIQEGTITLAVYGIDEEGRVLCASEPLSLALE